ncbi:MAG: riboflavin kinase [Oscillospiraceae bacterium]|nr:riboflavin kinase [Oscillospiraceae bacterium]
MIVGRVAHGKGQGGKIGFPTANLPIDCAQGVEYGVYAARAIIKGGCYPAVVNVGAHPTLPEGAPSVEAHILDESAELYGEELALELLAYLRSERKFESVAQLGRQIASDVDAARQICARHIGE